MFRFGGGGGHGGGGGGHGGGGHGGHGGGGRGGLLLSSGPYWGYGYGPDYDVEEETTTYSDGGTSEGGGPAITTVTRRIGSPYGLRG